MKNPLKRFVKWPLAIICLGILLGLYLLYAMAWDAIDSWVTEWVETPIGEIVMVTMGIMIVAFLLFGIIFANVPRSKETRPLSHFLSQWRTIILALLTMGVGIIVSYTYNPILGGWCGWSHVWIFLFILGFILSYMSLRKHLDLSTESLAQKQFLITVLSVIVFILVAYLGFWSLPEFEHPHGYGALIWKPLLLLGAGLVAHWFNKLVISHFNLDGMIRKLRCLRDEFHIPDEINLADDVYYDLDIEKLRKKWEEISKSSEEN